MRQSLPKKNLRDTLSGANCSSVAHLGRIYFPEPWHRAPSCACGAPTSDFESQFTPQPFPFNEPQKQVNRARLTSDWNDWTESVWAEIRFWVRQVDGGKRGVLRVVHMAEPNVTLMRDSLEQKLARRIPHLAYLRAPSVMRPVQLTFQSNIRCEEPQHQFQPLSTIHKKNKDTWKQRERSFWPKKILHLSWLENNLSPESVWPKSGADKTGP